MTPKKGLDMDKKAEGIVLRERISVIEYCAELRMENEAEWLMKWSEEQGLSDHLGKICGTPELVLDHIAGRVYEVSTNHQERYFVVVGHGYPSFYPRDEGYANPVDVLCFHRGRGLVIRMKFEYLKEKKKLEG
jgi:hypothetical protein